MAAEVGYVERTLAGGEALVRYQGGLALVAGALAGETVTFSCEGRHRGVMRGQLLSVVDTPSSHRIAAACPLATPSDTVCGGCALQMLAATEHARLKLSWISHHFAPLIDDSVAVGWLPGAPPAALWQRRRRVRWHVAVQGGGTHSVVVGFRPKRSHAVLDSGDCCVVTPALGALRTELQRAIEGGVLPPLAAVTATQLSDGIHIVIDGAEAIGGTQTLAPPSTPPFTTLQWEEGLSLPLQWWWRRGGDLQPWGSPVALFHDRLPAADGGDVMLEVGADSFVQADSGANRALIHWLIAQAQTGSRVVDLFCGGGNCSLPLATAGCTIVGADSSASAIASARRSSHHLGVETDYRVVDLFHQFDPEPFVGADLLLLDPPRKGARRVVSLMGRLLPRSIIMLHCDPAAGGRDAKAVAKQGYRLQALYALDMFAWSGHVETVSLWSYG
ncbi:MAG: methyltransferase [Mariprofundales bacterium]|nr:methyltransferase [Mariprofundales bacterium]